MLKQGTKDLVEYEPLEADENVKTSLESEEPLLSIPRKLSYRRHQHLNPWTIVSVVIFTLLYSFLLVLATTILVEKGCLHGAKSNRREFLAN
jgi:hypothetical protein